MKSGGYPLLEGKLELGLFQNNPIRLVKSEIRELRQQVNNLKKMIKTINLKQNFKGLGDLD